MSVVGITIAITCRSICVSTCTELTVLSRMLKLFKFSQNYTIPQCGTLRFMDGKISWVSPNDISGLNVKFGSKVASSTRMMRAFRFLESFFNYGKIFKKCQNSRLL